MKARDKKQKDYYKVIDYRDKLYYLICNGNDSYEWVRCYDWGKAVDNIYSSNPPIRFIGEQLMAINSETSTGVKLIQQLKRLPFEL